MGASVSVIVRASSGKSYTDLAVLKPSSTNPKQMINNLINYLMGVAQGQEAAIVDVDVAAAAVFASATVTCASVSALDTVTINGVVFTAVASSPSTNEWLQSGTNTEDAAALAAAINASTSARVSGCVRATSSGAVVTVYSMVAGLIGNVNTIVTSDGTRLAVTGAGYLASGAGVFSSTGKTSYTFGG